MATIEKIYLQDQNNTPQPYDIGAKAANITYDESDVSASVTTVQGKIKNIDNDHINGTVYSSQGKHKLRYWNNKLEVDTTGSGNQTAVGGGGSSTGKYINILDVKANVNTDGMSLTTLEPCVTIKQSESPSSEYNTLILRKKMGSFPTAYNDGTEVFVTPYPSSIVPEKGYFDRFDFGSTYRDEIFCYAFFLATDSSGANAKKDATFSVEMSSGYEENITVDADGVASHAEGDYTDAVEYAAHAEGAYSKAKGEASHAEGYQTTAQSDCAHAEGYKTCASASYSHAEGQQSYAIGSASHVEGLNAYAIGQCSHAEGVSTSAHDMAHAEGGQTSAYGDYSHTEGNFTTAYGNSSHAEGNFTTAYGDQSHAEGLQTYAQGTASHAEGQRFVYAIGNASHAEGYQTTAEGDCSHTEGNSTRAQGYASHAEGINTLITANAEGSHAEGRLTCVDALVAHAQGYHTCASNVASCSIGHYNAAMTTGGSFYNTTGTAFVIGNGGGVNSNAFSVQYDGTVAAANTITASTAADYAEFFEWADENPNSEDRVGYFVTIDDLDTTKIRIANAEDDYILGIVSGAPFVLGNGDCDVWNGLIMRDKFGRIMYEPAPKMEEIINEETGEITYRQARDEQGRPIYQGTKPIYNPEYDPTQAYIRRSERPEWAPVGMLGVLAVIDDGTCEVGQYCKCGAEGIATAAEGYNRNTYRVIKRVDENTIQVIFK